MEDVPDQDSAKNPGCIVLTRTFLGKHIAIKLHMETHQSHAQYSGLYPMEIRPVVRDKTPNAAHCKHMRLRNVFDVFVGVPS